jgi:hypothetical protein
MGEEEGNLTPAQSVVVSARFGSSLLLGVVLLPLIHTFPRNLRRFARLESSNLSFFGFLNSLTAVPFSSGCAMFSRPHPFTPERLVFRAATYAPPVCWEEKAAADLTNPPTILPGI